MQLIARAAWGAPATSPAAALPSARGVAVHYLGTRYDSRPHEQCAAQVRSIRSSHLANKQEGYLDIAYNLLVCEHGAVFEGRGIGRRSGANGGTTQNTSHYAVCALHGTTGQPSADLLRGLGEAIAHLQQHGAGREVVCHGDLTATSCPGGPLTSWVRAGHPLPPISTQPNTPTPEEDAVPHRALLETSGYTRTVEPNTWTTLNFNRLYDGSKWVAKDPEPSILLGPAYYTVSVAVRVVGLERGQEVQLRLARYRHDGTRYVRASAMPISSPVHDGGKGHFVHTWTGHVPAADRGRLRAEILVPQGPGVTVDYARAEGLHWPA
ncbi:peptidoglycan recognition protein family protein [Streptomyces xiamenensis]|uniref:peptidoglycan recognition protein family protein n=1 Tax=Streptomyces xiamenensis TaxID=408015 RepID=UPI003D75E7C5